MTNSNWLAPIANAPLQATVSLPGSKSLTNRELVLSALASGPSELVAPLVSRDSKLMISALEKLGTRFQWRGEDLYVEPNQLSGPASIDCGLAGTVMRFLPPLAALATGEIYFDGDEAARRRPMSTTIESLRKLGVEISDSTALPFTVSGSGKIKGGELSIDASASSQFVSGLLLAAARFEEGLTLTHTGKELPSLPHIEMTLDTIRSRGVQAFAISERSWRVEPGPIAGGRVVIEPDLSNAGPFLAAAMVASGSVTIPNWPSKTTQVGNEFRNILPRMGAEVKLDGNLLTVSGSGEIHGLDIDLSIGGELAPVIAALAALADSPSRLRGIAHLRGHETNRLEALTAEINRAGGNARETEDGLEIFPAELHGSVWRTYEDHRMATAGAIIGLRIPNIEIENIETTSKTMPEFANLWQEMLQVN